MSVPQLEFSPLLDWVEGRLSPQAAQGIELLLAGAEESACETARWLRAFTSVRREITLAAPPASTRELLRQRFAAYAANRRASDLLKHVVATLRFDDAMRPTTPLGTRAADLPAAQPRQLIFSCAAADIALNIHRRPHDKQIDISGQIFPHGAIAPSGWGVLLIGVAGPDATLTDELGEFSFEEVAPGEYTINLEIGRLAISVPMVTLE
ncbi:MAG: hypothetical protein HGA45_28185 [Chloroflexales bacterium]|nr:hypothetical protein [Chloroflexales bacterium]